MNALYPVSFWSELQAMKTPSVALITNQIIISIQKKHISWDLWNSLTPHHANFDMRLCCHQSKHRRSSSGLCCHQSKHKDLHQVYAAIKVNTEDLHQVYADIKVNTQRSLSGLC